MGIFTINPNKDKITKVERRINQLIEEFRKNPDKFLTEEDVRAYLYHLLLQDFGSNERTKDGEYSIPLHTEVRFYGSSGKLKFRSDIVIFEVNTLQTKNKEGFKLPTKGYHFDFPYIVIETKLRRNKKGSDNKFRKNIVADRRKIEQIRNETTHNFNSYIIALDKKRKIDFQEVNSNNHKEFYVSSLTPVT